MEQDSILNAKFLHQNLEIGGVTSGDDKLRCSNLLKSKNFNPRPTPAPPVRYFVSIWGKFGIFDHIFSTQPVLYLTNSLIASLLSDISGGPW